MTLSQTNSPLRFEFGSDSSTLDLKNQSSGHKSFKIKKKKSEWGSALAARPAVILARVLAPLQPTETPGARGKALLITIFKILMLNAGRGASIALRFALRTSRFFLFLIWGFCFSRPVPLLCHQWSTRFMCVAYQITGCL